MRPYEALINSMADARRIPRPVAQAMIDTENAPRDARRYVKEAWGGGSYGLSMITLQTARGCGFTGEPAKLFEPGTNLAFGFIYLRRMFDKVGRGDWSRAVAAYNAGPDLEPWPAAHVTRFRGHLARWQEIYSGGARPPILRAGMGSLLLIVLLGALLPMMLKKK